MTDFTAKLRAIVASQVGQAQSDTDEAMHLFDLLDARLRALEAPAGKGDDLPKCCSSESCVVTAKLRELSLLAQTEAARADRAEDALASLEPQRCRVPSFWYHPNLGWTCDEHKHKDSTPFSRMNMAANERTPCTALASRAGSA